jgi:hypothetical protein
MTVESASAPWVAGIGESWPTPTAVSRCSWSMRQRWAGRSGSCGEAALGLPGLGLPGRLVRRTGRAGVVNQIGQGLTCQLWAGTLNQQHDSAQSAQHQLTVNNIWAKAARGCEICVFRS